VTVTSSDTLKYPGEFEVLRTKAEAGLWDAGTLVMTNYRLAWTPKRFAKTPAFSFDLAEIASVRQVRLPKYLFLSVSLRFTLRGGSVYEIHRPSEDVNRLQHLVDDYRKRERYRPGKLFEDAP
jgi:hypothetical protein